MSYLPPAERTAEEEARSAGAARARQRRRRSDGRAARGARAPRRREHENEERWLLTYADMITLLMALFMVLFSISSVNISKYKTLQQSLQRGLLRTAPAGRQGDPAAGLDRRPAPRAGHRRRYRRSCR